MRQNFAQSCNAGQQREGAGTVGDSSEQGVGGGGVEQGASCAVDVGGVGAMCVRRGRSCVTHKVRMTRRAVKERVWKKRADGLFGYRTVVRSDWVCGLEDFPRTISQNTQTQGQGASQSADLLHRLGGGLEHGQTAMDYEISAASLKRSRGWK